jgi:hypothetical protein
MAKKTLIIERRPKKTMTISEKPTIIFKKKSKTKFRWRGAFA